MGISSVGTLESAAVSRNRMTVQQAEARQSRETSQEAAAQTTDVVSKNIRDEISEVQRQKQGLSSKQEMSEAERSKKKQELQQKLNSLNTRLRQRQAEVSRKQKQADRLEELSASDTSRTHRTEESGRPKTAPDRKSGKNTRQGIDAEAPVTKDAAPKMTDAENTERSAGKTERNTGTSERNTGMTGHSTGKPEHGAGEIKRSTEDNRDEQLKASGIPQDKMLSIVSGEISIEQTDRREAVIARIEGGIAILKGEIRQDEMLGNDVQKKKTELKSREMKVRNAVNELPVINAPGRKSDDILRNAGKVKADNEERAKARIFKRSLDGVVVLKSGNGVFAAAADV